MHFHFWVYNSKDTRYCRACGKKQVRDYGDGMWNAWLKKWRDV